MAGPMTRAHLRYAGAVQVEVVALGREIIRLKTGTCFHLNILVDLLGMYVCMYQDFKFMYVCMYVCICVYVICMCMYACLCM